MYQKGSMCVGLVLTDDHDVKVEALAHTLAVPLVWQIGEADEAGQFASHNVLVLQSGGSGSLWVF